MSGRCVAVGPVVDGKLQACELTDDEATAFLSSRHGRWRFAPQPLHEFPQANVLVSRTPWRDAAAWEIATLFMTGEPFEVEPEVLR